MLKMARADRNTIVPCLLIVGRLERGFDFLGDHLMA